MPSVWLPRQTENYPPAPRFSSRWLFHKLLRFQFFCLLFLMDLVHAKFTNQESRAPKLLIGQRFSLQRQSGRTTLEVTRLWSRSIFNSGVELLFAETISRWTDTQSCFRQPHTKRKRHNEEKLGRLTSHLSTCSAIHTSASLLQSFRKLRGS